MFCGEQGGIFKVLLYENVGFTVIRDSEGNVERVLNNGEALTFTECENLSLGYIDKEIVGKNDKSTHEYTITFSLFGFSDAYEDLDKLASVFGYIPVVYFRNDFIGIVLSPIYKNTDVKYSEDKTQVYPLAMSSIVPTFEKLQEFEATPTVWVLENGVWGGAETVWTADGIWNTI